jgi:hypothetical protein
MRIVNKADKTATAVADYIQTLPSYPPATTNSSSSSSSKPATRTPSTSLSQLLSIDIRELRAILQKKTFAWQPPRPFCKLAPPLGPICFPLGGVSCWMMTWIRRRTRRSLMGQWVDAVRRADAAVLQGNAAVSRAIRGNMNLTIAGLQGSERDHEQENGNKRLSVVLFFKKVRHALRVRGTVALHGTVDKKRSTRQLASLINYTSHLAIAIRLFD